MTPDLDDDTQPTPVIDPRLLARIEPYDTGYRQYETETVQRLFERVTDLMVDLSIGQPPAPFLAALRQAKGELWAELRMRGSWK